MRRLLPPLPLLWTLPSHLRLVLVQLSLLSMLTHLLLLLTTTPVSSPYSYPLTTEGASPKHYSKRHNRRQVYPTHLITAVWIQQQKELYRC